MNVRNPIPTVETAKDIARELGRSPAEKGVLKLAKDLASVACGDAPSCTDENIRTIRACVALGDDAELRHYISLLLGVAYVQGKRSEIQARINELQRVPIERAGARATSPLAYRPDGSPADILPVPVCPACGANLSKTAEGTATTCPHGCSGGVHFHNLEHADAKDKAEADERFDTGNEV